MASAADIVELTAELEVPPRVVTAPDPDASAVPHYLASGAQLFRLGATCGTASASLAGRVCFIDSKDRVICGVPFRFTSGAKPDWGPTTYIGTAASDAWWPLAGAKAVAVKIDEVTGTWTIDGAMN